MCNKFYKNSNLLNMLRSEDHIHAANHPPRLLFGAGKTDPAFPYLILAVPAFSIGSPQTVRFGGIADRYKLGRFLDPGKALGCEDQRLPELGIWVDPRETTLPLLSYFHLLFVLCAANGRLLGTHVLQYIVSSHDITVLKVVNNFSVLSNVQ